jgi:hypothetical protein
MVMSARPPVTTADAATPSIGRADHDAVGGGCRINHAEDGNAIGVSQAPSACVGAGWLRKA